MGTVVQDDPEGHAAPQRLTPAAIPELTEALSRAIPAVARWLTGTQWARLLAVGVQLFKGFGRAFTKRRPAVARAVAKMPGASEGPWRACGWPFQGCPPSDMQREKRGRAAGSPGRPSTCSC